MKELDEIARINLLNWEKDVRDGVPYTVPFLNLSAQEYKNYAVGKSEKWPCKVWQDSAGGILMQKSIGKKVLCLASGGGQQSAELSLLGAQVTVLDLCPGQLEADNRAAAHYGYSIQTVQGDMRDLSEFDDNSFDNVLQGVSLTFVPDVRKVYKEVYRVLRPGGYYAVDHCNPATYPICFDGPDNGWDGTAYRISEPYSGGPILRDSLGHENMKDGKPTGEHRHLLRDIFNGLIENGFTIRNVWDQTWQDLFDVLPLPGSDEYELAFRAYFCVLVQKPI